MRVHLTGHLDVPPARLPEVLAALPEHTRLTVAEPGNLRFAVTPAAEDPGRLWVEETFRDRAAFDAHQARAQASPWGELTRGLPRTYFLIREATKADRAQLARIYLACRRRTFHWMPPDTFALDDFEPDTDGELVLACEREGELVGFAGFWTHDDFLHHLFVLHEHHGHGAGRGLLRAVRTYAKGPVRLKCVVQNERACRFYERLGGVITATHPEGPEGPFHTIVLP